MAHELSSRRAKQKIEAARRSGAKELRRAKQRIEAARRSGAKDLDLRNLKLTELPESLGQLTQLQSLELSDNQLRELPEWLGQLDRPRWISAKFRVTLWCEHSRMPLPALNGEGDTRGVYELSLPRDWFVKAAPFMKVLTSTLSLVVPVASSAANLAMDEADYRGIEKQLDLGQKSLDSVLKGGEQAGAWLGRSDAPDLEHAEAIEARGADLRQLQAWLKAKDPSFGGLVRVMNKRQEFLWVHPQFEGEY